MIPAIVALALQCVSTNAEVRTGIAIKGSDTMVILMKSWAEAYSRLKPGVSIQVTGGGTGTGMAALINRTTGICMASRPIRPDETEAAIKAFSRRPLGFEVALDALVVFVNETNPLTELSLPHLADLFTTRIRNWEELGGPDAAVVLYSRENSSGTYEFFKEHVLRGQDFAPATQTMPGTSAVLAAVSRDRWGIGYGGRAFSIGARQMAIRADDRATALLPTEENVITGHYPIARALRLYINPALYHGPIKEFLLWIRGNEGQEIVREVGYFPLPPQSRSDSALGQ